MTGSQGYGQFQPSDATSEFNRAAFLVRQMMGRMRTATPVLVKKVTATGGHAIAGTVDVQPLICQVDGQRNATPHGTIYGIPYFRLQGGPNAVVLDPVVGDIGYMIVSDRDMSSVKAAKAVANPGSMRKFDLADGVYVGGILNGEPTQYLEFMPDGVKLVDKNNNTFTMNAAGMQMADKFGNTFTLDTNGMSFADKNGNGITMSSAGIVFTGIRAQFNTTHMTINSSIDGTLTGGGTGGALVINSAINQTSGNFTTAGGITSGGDVTINGKPFLTHIHGAPGGNTSPPL